MLHRIEFGRLPQMGDGIQSPRCPALGCVGCGGRDQAVAVDEQGAQRRDVVGELVSTTQNLRELRYVDGRLVEELEKTLRR